MARLSILLGSPTFNPFAGGSKDQGSVNRIEQKPGWEDRGGIC